MPSYLPVLTGLTLITTVCIRGIFPLRMGVWLQTPPPPFEDHPILYYIQNYLLAQRVERIIKRVGGGGGHVYLDKQSKNPWIILNLCNVGIK